MSVYIDKLRRLTANHLERKRSTVMALTPCRECGREVSSEAFSCPQCGAPRPSCRSGPARFEWKSRRRIFGILWFTWLSAARRTGKLRVARGLVAVGQFGVGLVTVAHSGSRYFRVRPIHAGIECASPVCCRTACGSRSAGLWCFRSGPVRRGDIRHGASGLGEVLLGPSRVDMEAVAMFSPFIRRCQFSSDSDMSFSLSPTTPLGVF